MSILKRKISVEVGDSVVNAFLFRRPRQKNIRLSVKNKEIFVSAPFFSSWDRLVDFIEEQKTFIISSLKENSLSIFTKDHYKKNRKIAESILLDYCQDLVQKTGLCPGRISIRNQAGRWGSCSSRKVISLNYKLAFLPKILAEYVIIHELCHLRFMNHQKDFWSLVESFLPEYRKYRKELKNLSREFF